MCDFGEVEKQKPKESEGESLQLMRAFQREGVAGAKALGWECPWREGSGYDWAGMSEGDRSRQ